MAGKIKLFRDPVHGYIEVDTWMCNAFIDTDIFQRLRFVEQSSMRMLFPGAHHDRFIHSLGVYLMAKRIFENLEDGFREKFDEEAIHEFRNTFLTAALLHDCAHSPFSHTGESLAEDYCYKEIVESLLTTVNSKGFTADFHKARCATHEMASAYVACKRFANEFAAHSINMEQFARMIIGARNCDDEDLVKKAYNCLIELINGFIVDADRLDYLERDTWATGIRNATVDFERLISGLDIDLTAGCLRVKHKAVSSLINAVSARDYLYQWVIPHHKVSYANFILVGALRRLVERLAELTDQSPVEVGKYMFSPDRLLSPGKMKLRREIIYLPTDGDFLYLMKKYIANDKCFRAYVERKHLHASLWKTHAEFMNIFKCNHKKTTIPVFWDFFYARAKKICDKFGALCTEPREIKVSKKSISTVNIFAEGGCGLASVDKRRLNLSYLLECEKHTKKTFFMNVFVAADGIKKAPEILRELKKCYKECLNCFV